MGARTPFQSIKRPKFVIWGRIILQLSQKTGEAFLFLCVLCIVVCMREGERKKEAYTETLGLVDKHLLATLYARGVLFVYGLVNRR